MRTGALASAPAAFPLKRGLTLERFGGAPKPARQQQQRSGSILPHFLLRPGALARRRKLAFRAPQKQQRSGSIFPPFFIQAPCSLLAAESWLSHQTSAPALYFLAFYAGSAIRLGPGAFSGEKSDQRGASDMLSI